MATLPDAPRSTLRRALRVPYDLEETTMPEYTLACNQCDDKFERFAWGELGDTERSCPRCHSYDVTVRWIMELPFENLANFGCA